MAFRVLLIENEVNIKLNLDNLVITKEEKDIWVPIRDLSMIVLDNLKTNLTSRMLCALAKNNVGIIICDQEHLPIGFYSSFDNHSRISKTIKYQTEKDENFYALLWEKIVKEKIKNQIRVLKLLDKSEDIQNKMNEFIKQMQHNDENNREAHSAKIYFNELMECSFSRRNDDILLNSGLNYGYTIIRSFLARVCVGYGLNTQLGIHHKNEYNRFNFVDDIIEPIRPFIDYFAYNLLKEEKYFTPNHRRELINFLNHKVLYNNKKMYICNMLEEYVYNIAGYFEGRKEEIIFPNVEDYIGKENEV